MNISKNFKKQFIINSLLILVAFVAHIPATNRETLTQNNIIEAAQAERPQKIVYTVKPGDSLHRIANKYKVHVYQVRAWNDLGNTSLLRPGQKITIHQVDYEARDGLASWYGPGFHGQNMANTEVYNMYDIVVAHRTLPLGRKVKITNLDNGKSIIAPVLDRGPYVKNSQGEYTREIDLSYGVALALGTIKKGVVPARIEPLDEPLPLD